MIYPKPNTKKLGDTAEEAAVQFLQRQGYRILERNFRTRLGEIDIIAREQGVLCFIEVKMRQSEEFGEALEAISVFKQRKICKMSLVYLNYQKLEDVEMRFDVVTLDKRDGDFQFELLRDAFEFLR